MSSASAVYEELRSELMGRRAHHPDDGDLETMAHTVVERYQRLAEAGVGGRPLADPATFEAALVRSVDGRGELDHLLGPDTPAVEVDINGAEASWQDASGRWHAVEGPSSEPFHLALVNRLLQPTGRVLDVHTPLVSAQVLDRRVRLTAAIPPVADCLNASLRLYRAHLFEFDEMVAADTMSGPMADLLWTFMQTTTGVLIAGGPKTGKTTLFNTLLRAVSPSRTVRVCEETRELSAPIIHGGYYQTRHRPPGAEGGVEVDLRRLVGFQLGTSPDVIGIGEIRGAESFELTRAGNAGCAVLASIHANSARDALVALINTALMAGPNIPEAFVRSVFASIIDLVVYVDREDPELRPAADDRPLRHQVLEIAAVDPTQAADRGVTLRPIFVRDAIGAPVRLVGPPPEGLRARLDRVLRPRGTSVQAILEGHGGVRR